MFNKDSGLVKTWVSLIQKGIYTADNIPAISNLRDIVLEVLTGGE